MATYRTTDQAVYLSDIGLMVYVGQTFTTDIAPGRTWEPIDDVAKAACKAAFPDKYPDEPEPIDDVAKARGRKPASADE